jgi:DNA-directed RNA polymerase specialized sigma24 family protein
MDAAFGRSYTRLISWCRRHVRRNLGDPEDFVHQAYLRSRRRWATARRSQHREEAYFFRALRWVVTDAMRKRARRREGMAAYQPAAPASAAGPVGELIAREAVDAALTPGERAVCSGLLAGRSRRQLCDALAVTPAALAVRACRARRKLREFLGA